MAKRIRGRMLSLMLTMLLLALLCAQSVSAAAPPLWGVEETGVVPPQATPTDQPAALGASASLQAAIDAATGGTEATPTDIVVSDTVALDETLVLNNGGVARHIRLTGGGRVTRAPGFTGTMVRVGQATGLSLDNITLDGANGREGDVIQGPIIDIYMGTLHIHEGAVLENNKTHRFTAASQFGSAINCWDAWTQGEFSICMDGGIIRNNSVIHASSDHSPSAGVYLDNGSRMQMSGGQIVDNGSFTNGNAITYDVLGHIHIFGNPIIGNEGGTGFGWNSYGNEITIDGDLTTGAAIYLGPDYASSEYHTIATRPGNDIPDTDVAAFHSGMVGYEVVRSAAYARELVYQQIKGIDLQALIDAAPVSTAESPYEIEAYETIYLHEPIQIVDSISGEARNIRLKGATLKRAARFGEAMLVVPKNSYLELAGTTLDGYGYQYPGYSRETIVLNEGVLDIRAGTQLINNEPHLANVNLQGGALFNTGTVNMHGGLIADNVLSPWNGSRASWVYSMGAGVYNEGIFNLLGGSIEGNQNLTNPKSNTDTIEYLGGGIYNAGMLAISGGSVSGNAAIQGGGVYNVGQMIISGGSVEDNEATGKAGGIYTTGPLSIAGGAVIGNTAPGRGGEVYLDGQAGITLGGSARVGQQGAAAGLYQASVWRNGITIAEALGSGAYVVLETALSREGVVVAQGNATYAVAMADAFRFKTAEPYLLIADQKSNALVTATGGRVPRTLAFTHPGLILAAGQSEQLEVAYTYPEITTVGYTVRKAEPSGILSVDANGTVTTTGAGTAYVRAYCVENPDVYDECRIDVTAPIQPGDVMMPYHLADTTVTLYTKQDVPVEIGLWQEAAKPGFRLGGLVGRTLEFFPAGASASHSKTADAAGLVFSLAVTGERGAVFSLKAGVEEKSLKTSYKVKLRVVGEENPLPETLTIKVNKKAPSLKARPISINYFYSDLRALIHIDGAAVSALQLNPDKAAANDKLLNAAKGGWLQYQNGVVTLAKEAKKSGSLYLWATVEGWKEPVPVTVSVKAVSTPPAVKLSAGTLHFFGPQDNSVRSSDASVFLQPKNKNDTLKTLGITDVILIPENELTKAEAKKYKNQFDHDYLLYNPDTGEIRFWHKGYHSFIFDKNPGPYLLGVKVDGSDKYIRVSLKTTLKTSFGKLVFNKSTVTLDPRLGEDDSVTLTYKHNSVPTANFVVDKPDILLLKEGRVYYEVPYSLWPVEIRQNAGNSITITPRAGYLTPGATYVLQYTYPTTVDASRVGATLLTVKAQANDAKQAYATLTGKGNVDLSKSGAGATVTAKFSGYNGSYTTINPLIIKDPSGVVVTGIFDVARTGDNTWLICGKPTESLAAGTYTLSASGQTASGHSIASVKDIKLKVTASKPKLGKSVSSVTLYPSDPAGEQGFYLTLPAGYNAIDNVEVTNLAKHAYDIEYVGNNYCTVKFRSGQPGGAQDAAKATVNFSVTLKGNSAAIIKSSIKVNIS